MNWGGWRHIISTRDRDCDLLSPPRAAVREKALVQAKPTKGAAVNYGRRQKDLRPSRAAGKWTVKSGERSPGWGSEGEET